MHPMRWGSFASSVVLFQVKRVPLRNQKSVLYDHQKKSLVCSETCCLKNGQKTETDNSINFGLLGATFLLFRFPSLFSSCCLMQYPSKAELSLTAFILKNPCPNLPNLWKKKLKCNSHFYSCKITRAKRLNKF